MQKQKEKKSDNGKKKEKKRGCSLISIYSYVPQRPPNGEGEGQGGARIRRGGNTNVRLAGPQRRADCSSASIHRSMRSDQPLLVDVPNRKPALSTTKRTAARAGGVGTGVHHPQLTRTTEQNMHG